MYLLVGYLTFFMVSKSLLSDTSLKSYIRNNPPTFEGLTSFRIVMFSKTPTTAFRTTETSLRRRRHSLRISENKYWISTVRSDFLVCILLTLHVSTVCVFTLSPGCIDGVVGLAARVALIQVPWLTLEEQPSPDLTNHIAALEAMLSEMQMRVRQMQREGKLFRTD